MVLTVNASSVILSAGIIAFFLLLRRKVISLSKIAAEKLVNLKQTLLEMERQQQVIYNTSTSIFLLHSVEEIIRSTISEIVIMYHWPNVAYFPYGKGEKRGEHMSVFLVGRLDRPLGVLYVGKTGGVLTENQNAFFKTIASFLTIAIDNIQVLNKR